MQNYFFIRNNGKYIKISFNEIVYVEGCRNYVKVITENKSHLVLFSMKGIEKFLPSYLFKRVHKSFIVSLDKISSFDGDRVYIKDKELPIGQQYKGELEKAVMIVSDTVGEFNSMNSYYELPLVINANKRNRLFEAG